MEVIFVVVGVMLVRSGRIGQRILRDKMLQLEKVNEAVSLDNINEIYPSQTSSQVNGISRLIDIDLDSDQVVTYQWKIFGLMFVTVVLMVIRESLIFGEI
jgi:hypothetical protein